jgi:hypothetical protein
MWASLRRSELAAGLRAGREQLVRAAVEDLCDMFTDPIKWARRWLMEFRDDPDGVVLFADHWRRQYETVKGALEQNPSDPQHDSTHFCFSTLVPSTLTSRR